MHFSKKTIIIIAAVSFLTIIGLLGVWLSGKYTDSGTKEVGKFSFFGGGEEETGGLTSGKAGGSGGAGGETSAETGKSRLPELRKISSSPAAGIYTFEKSIKGENGTKTNVVFLRRVDRTTGNVFETRADNMEETRVTNTTIPKIYEVNWLNNENSLILRYLRDDGETIETYFSKITEGPEGKDGGLTGTFLPQDVKSLAVSPKKDRLFYLTVSGGEATGTIMNVTDSKKSVPFRHSFTEWLFDWPADNIITLTTKPSGKVFGFMYSINSSGGNFTKLLGDKNGLTALMSPDGKKILYSESSALGFSAKLYDVASGNSDDEPRTLPEKCVWSLDNDVFYCAIPVNPVGALYPDAWYQGLVSFSDVLARIDAKNGSVTVLVDPKEFVGEEIDATNLQLSKNEDYLFFLNKKDGSSWLLEMGI